MPKPNLDPGEYIAKLSDRDTGVIDDGWTVVRLAIEDNSDDDSEDILGVLDTEALADMLMSKLCPGRDRFKEGVWYRL
jgi:hypothetical protein